MPKFNFHRVFGLEFEILSSQQFFCSKQDRMVPSTTFGEERKHMECRQLQNEARE